MTYEPGKSYHHDTERLFTAVWKNAFDGSSVRGIREQESFLVLEVIPTRGDTNQQIKVLFSDGTIGFIGLRR